MINISRSPRQETPGLSQPGSRRAGRAGGAGVASSCLWTLDTAISVCTVVQWGPVGVYLISHTGCHPSGDRDWGILVTAS